MVTGLGLGLGLDLDLVHGILEHILESLMPSLRRLHRPGIISYVNKTTPHVFPVIDYTFADHQTYCLTLSFLSMSGFSYLWPPCIADADIIFCPVVSSSIFFFFSLPNLSRHRLDVYHTSTHAVALVQI